MTRPTPVWHPIVAPAQACLRAAQAAIRHGSSVLKIDRLLRNSRNHIERAEKAGVPLKTLKALRTNLRRLENEAEARLRELVAGPLMPRRERTPVRAKSVIFDKWSRSAAERMAPTVQRALRDPNHWLHRDYVDRLVEVVSGNHSISRSYRERLPRDIAEVLQVTPNALGLVKEATHRGQRNPLASRGKLGYGTGSVYEIMGSAALIRKASNAANTGIPLHITAGQDRVDFGIKLQASYRDKAGELTLSRKAVEADTLILKPDGREVAIDFKHVKGAGSYSDKTKTKPGESGLTSQVDGIVNALRTGEIDEFHFVTNGHFSKGFRKVVDEANEILKNEGHTPISYHDYVW